MGFGRVSIQVDFLFFWLFFSCSLFCFLAQNKLRRQCHDVCWNALSLVFRKTSLISLSGRTLLITILLEEDRLFLPELSLYLFYLAYKSPSSLYLLNLNKNFDPFSLAITLIGKEGSEEIKLVI